MSTPAKAVPVKAVPEGYHTVTPYLVVQGAGKLIDFLKAAFDAQENFRMPMPDGSIGHAEVRIGNSMVMLGEARDQWKAMPATLQLYLEDVDAVYARAVAAGATPVAEPTNQFYGDRRGGVQDMCGNNWWMATHIEDVSEEEMKRRMDAAAGGH
jgi:PhnB protein